MNKKLNWIPNALGRWYLALSLSLLSVSTTNAQGLDGITDLAERLGDWLNATGVAVITIAIMWCGYIMLFSRGSTSQIPFILGGGVVIGAATQIANFIFSGTAPTG